MKHVGSDECKDQVVSSAATTRAENPLNGVGTASTPPHPSLVGRKMNQSVVSLHGIIIYFWQDASYYVCKKRKMLLILQKM